MGTPVEKACIICGQKSHRADWQSAQYPVCDNHSKQEVQQALAKAAAPSPAPVKNGPTNGPATPATA